MEPPTEQPPYPPPPKKVKEIEDDLEYTTVNLTGSADEEVPIHDHVFGAKAISIKNPHGVIDTNTYVLYVSRSEAGTNGYPIGPGKNLVLEGPFDRDDFLLYVTSDNAFSCRLMIQRVALE